MGPPVTRWMCGRVWLIEAPRPPPRSSKADLAACSLLAVCITGIPNLRPLPASLTLILAQEREQACVLARTPTGERTGLCPSQDTYGRKNRPLGHVREKEQACVLARTPTGERTGLCPSWDTYGRENSCTEPQGPRQRVVGLKGGEIQGAIKAHEMLRKPVQAAHERPRARHTHAHTAHAGALARRRTYTPASPGRRAPHLGRAKHVPANVRAAAGYAADLESPSKRPIGRSRG
eukprot:358644-Chlamydomonas_euryale.AAC.5